jgi:hypothetical protein
VISRFQSYSLENAYLRHADMSFRVDFSADDVANSQFVVVPGLADPEAVSIESVNIPGYYVRHQDNIISLNANDRSETFGADATWWIRPGLADSAWISFESYNQPGSYIGQQFGIVALVEVTDETPERVLGDATFMEER